MKQKQFVAKFVLNGLLYSIYFFPFSSEGPVYRLYARHLQCKRSLPLNSYETESGAVYGAVVDSQEYV